MAKVGRIPEGGVGRDVTIMIEGPYGDESWLPLVKNDLPHLMRDISRGEQDTAIVRRF